MKSLIIFDNLSKVEDIRRILRDQGAKAVDTFSLTDSVSIALKSDEKPDSKFTVNHLDSISLIGEELDIMRSGIGKWSSGIGESMIGGRKIKDWFILPGANLSTWWLSLLSERNTLKTDAFLRIAQLNAIRNLLKRNQYISCIISISEEGLREAAESLARGSCGLTQKLALRRKGSIKSQVKDILQGLGAFGNGILGIAFAFQFFGRGILARRYLGSYRKRLPSGRSLLLVTYSAVIEECEKRNDALFHRYDTVLQQKIGELNIPITWLLMYVPLRDRNFYDFIMRAKSFKRKEGRFFIPEEFFTFKIFLKSLFLLVRQILLSEYIFKRIDKTVLYGEPPQEGPGIYVKSLWRQSFSGTTGISGIIHYFIFREVFAKVPLLSDCLYYWEMQAWEKALNAAKDYANPSVRTIGFQHSTLPKNLFNLFCDKSEITFLGKASDLPVPDVMVCNGEIPFSILSESGYSGLTKAEATRYMYLNEILSSPPRTKQGRPVLLVVGSSDRVESTALTALVNSSFPRADAFDIWFKGHICLPLENIFRALKIDPSEAGYVMRSDSISECLRHARAVLVPSSSVAIEALAFGCEVIIPFFPNAIPINPLIDYPGFYHKVKSVKELACVVSRIIKGHSLHNIDEYRSFVKSYWCLDSKLPHWRGILTRKGS